VIHSVTASSARVRVAAACGAACALAVCAGPPPAAAQTAPDSARAEALFQQARQATAEGRLAEACSLFEASQRLDPGGGTLLNMAVCHEQLGKTATAWQEFQQALARAREDKRADREALARTHLENLSARLVWLTVTVAPDALAPGLEVTRNGIPVPAADYNKAVPIDPGDYVLAARAPGRESWQTRVPQQGEGAKLRIAVPKLRPISGSSRIRPLQIAGLALGGAGLVSAGVGIFFGADAIAQNRAAAMRCSDTTCPDPASLALSQDAGRSATIANVTIGAGLAAIAGGAALFFIGGSTARDSGPSGSKVGRSLQVTPVITPDGGAISIRGTL
jgi:hypothetical protein